MLRKTTVFAELALALMLVAVPAHAGNWMIGLNAGAGIPRRDFKDAAKLGFIGGLDLDYFATEKLAVGIDGFFISNSGSDSLEARLTYYHGTPVTAKFTMLQGGAHLKYVVSQTTISPFLLLGLGAYKMKDSRESSDPVVDSPGAYDTFLGTRAGLGLMYKTSEEVCISVEGAIHGVWTAFDWNNAFTVREFVSVQTGVSIRMGNPAQ